MFFFTAVLASLVVFGAAARAPDPQADDLPDSPLVSTLAGSGALGIADGAGSAASFVSPTGLAFGRDGTLYVADRNAQRIRTVAPNGDVATLAGAAVLVPLGIGAPGGYRDGPAAQALFNMPSAVLARDDGSVLVADTANYCIRRVRNGSVTTVAGDRSRGNRDGAGAGAEFSLPVALAQDAAGNVLVADPPNGVRRIDRSGQVTTLRFPGASNVIAIAVPPGDPGSLLVASVTRVARLNLRTLALDRPFPLQLLYDSGVPPGDFALHEGNAYFGPLAALAAFNNFDFVFTDPFSSAVRFAQTTVGGPTTLDYSRTLTAVPREDAELGVTGFRDGPGPQALVDEPSGIAIAPGGTIAFSDTGNRRIRILSRFNHRTHLEAQELGTELPGKPDPREYRIAIVGNSNLWWNQSWHHSIAGEVEDRLLAASQSKRRMSVMPIMREGITSLSSLNLIDNELSEGVANMVVLDVTTYGQAGGDGNAGPAFPPGWQEKLAAAVANTAKGLRSAGVAFLVLNHPGATDLPGEFEYAHLYKPGAVYANDSGNVQYYHDELAKTLAVANVPTLDLWPAFLSAYAAPSRVPLFNAWDHHLSPAGTELVAHQLAERILELRPWER